MWQIPGLGFPSSSWWRICLALVAALMTNVTVSQHAHGMQLAAGSYTGNGAANHAITGAGFRPDAVIIKGNTSQYAVMQTATMPAGMAKEIAAKEELDARRIQSLDADGFTVGRYPQVNRSGVGYSWVAFKDDGAGDFRVGSYVGDGSANRSIYGLGFQPDYVIVMSAEARQAIQRSSTMLGDISFQFDASGPTTNAIRALKPDGFQVGSEGRVNAAGTIYHYAAWKAGGGSMSVGSYAGNGTDNRSVTGAGFGPEYVIIKAGTNEEGVHRTAVPPGDSTLAFGEKANFTNAIQALGTDGFQVGTARSVNAPGAGTYFWMAFRGALKGDPPTTLAISSVNDGAHPTAGSGFSVIVQSQDGSGLDRNVASATGVQLRLKTGSGTLGGTLTGTIPAGANQLVISGVTYTKSESGVVLTATCTSGAALTPGDSAPFTVDPGIIAGYALSLASPQPAGVTFGITVSAQDRFANPVTTDSSTLVTFASASGHLLFDADGDGTFGDAAKTLSAGTLTMNARSTVAETTTVSATDASGMTGSASLTIIGAAPSALAFITQPGNAVAGAPVGGPPTVAVQDAFGNTSSSSNASISMAIGTNPGGGALSGTTTKAATTGIASFTDLTISKPGSGYTLIASSAGLSAATSSAFTIASTPGAISGRVTRASDGAGLSGVAIDALQGTAVKGSTTSGPDGTYTIAGLVPGSYDVRASASGYQSQTLTGIAVTAGHTAIADLALSAVSGITITITAPPTGSVLREPATVVQGEVSGDGAIGVTLTMVVSINGETLDLPMPVEVNGGRFAAWVALAPGPVGLTARATNATGLYVQDSVAVSFEPDPPEYDQAAPPDVSPTAGFAPLTVTFGASASADATVSALDLDADGDGRPDFTLTDFTAPLYQVTYTYRKEGLYIATMVVRDQAGQSRTTSVPINVYARPALASIWDAFRDALGRADIDAAAGHVALEARDRYRDVFSDLQADLPSIAGALGTITANIATAEYATGAVTRVLHGVSAGFLVHFVRDADGIWRIASM